MQENKPYFAMKEVRYILNVSEIRWGCKCAIPGPESSFSLFSQFFDIIHPHLRLSPKADCR